MLLHKNSDFFLFLFFFSWRMQQWVKPGCYGGCCMRTGKGWGKKNHSKACASLQAFKFPSFIPFGAFKYYTSLSWSPCCHSNFHSCSSCFNSSPISIIITWQKAHLRFTQKDWAGFLFYFFFLFIFLYFLPPHLWRWAARRAACDSCNSSGWSRARCHISVGSLGPAGSVRGLALLGCCSSQIKLAAEPTWGITKRRHQWGNTGGRSGWLNGFDVANVVKGHYCRVASFIRVYREPLS